MADEDIFMEYAGSSPIDSQNSLKFNIPHTAKSFEDFKNEKELLLNNLSEQNQNSSISGRRLQVLKLRQFNRRLAHELIDKRKKLTELKETVDSFNSKLMCLKFEKQHFLNEIKACLSSKNIYESIELEPLEAESCENEHDLMIKRLQRELAKRQELQGHLISILQRKQQTETELERKKKKMDELRHQLQALLKNSKPLVDICGYDLEALHKKKMQIEADQVIISNKDKNEHDSESEGGNENLLQAIYEKLVTFVADKVDYKLRYFDALEAVEDEEDLSAEPEISTERDSSIKSAYIQVNLQVNPEGDTGPLDIFLTVQDSKILLLTVKHELISESGLVSWLKSLGTIEFSDYQQQQDWLIPVKIQPDSLSLVPESESFDQVFTALKDALQLRHQILEHLNNLPFEDAKFDKNNPSQLIISSGASVFKAEITMNAITWNCESEKDSELVSLLNSIGSKYRSVYDCLQAQLELLSNQ